MIEDAKSVKERQETDSIPVIDDIRSHIRLISIHQIPDIFIYLHIYIYFSYRYGSDSPVGGLGCPRWGFLQISSHIITIYQIQIYLYILDTRYQIYLYILDTSYQIYLYILDTRYQIYFHILDTRYQIYLHIY